MTRYTKAGKLSEEELMRFENHSSSNLKPTGELILKEDGDCNITKIVYKGSWTPYGFIRDCGDHYIEALYSSYRWISKDLKTIKEDVEDY